MKKYTAFLLFILTCQLSLLFISCNQENVSDTVVENATTSNDSIYAVDKELLGDWQEGYIKYLEGSESLSCYVVSTYDSDDNLRTTYLGQLDKDVMEGYYLFTDKEGVLMELKCKDFTYVYDFVVDEGVWTVYDNDGEFIKALELGKVNLKCGSTRGLMDNIFDLRSWFNNANLGFHQEWGELILNIGTNVALKTLKIGSWPVQLIVEGLSAAEQAYRKAILYDGCVPQVKSCDKSGKIEVIVNGVSNLTDKYFTLSYNHYKDEFERVENPGKEVSMAVAIRKDESYVTYSNCDNHTTYLKISSSQGNITVSSPIKFEPGVDYYLRPYLIEKTLFDSNYNTFRQRYIQYGDVYKFRYTDVEIKKIEKIFLKDFSQSHYALRLKISAHIESLSGVRYWGIALYDKNHELLKQLECFSDNGKKDYDFQYDDLLDKSLFKDGTTILKLVPYAIYDDQRYAYGEAETYTLSDYGCPDFNHPHSIDLGLPSGTKWACCNVGASKPEDKGGHYAFGEVETKSNYTIDTYQYAVNDAHGFLIKDTRYFYTFIDIGLNIAGTIYDAATVNWGDSWCMPTRAQCNELRNYTSSEYTTQNGVDGLKITGNNGATIFLPAAGYRAKSYDINDGYGGMYWHSSFGSGFWINAYYLRFSGSSLFIDSEGERRWYGLSIRPVRKN